MKRKLLGLLIATSSLLAVSCSQSEDFVLSDNGNGEEVTVSFSVSADDGKLSTRGVGEDGELDNYISDGTKADMLVYAVYVAENGEYRLLEQYGQDISVSDMTSLEMTDDEKTDSNHEYKGVGQTILYTQKLLKREEGGEQITLRLMRGKTYRIAFWAQNHQCKAYTTNDLSNVTVHYTNAANNDELRDAFSMALEFEAQPDLNLTAVLYRVMAQVNVGTSGWDYNEEIDFGNTYLYSKIELEGVYNTFDAVAQKVDRGIDKDGVNDKRETVAYTWAALPAYRHLTSLEGQTDWRNKQENEEFLYVKLIPHQDDEQIKGTEGKYELNAAKYEEGKGNYEGKYFLKYLETAPAESETEQKGIYGIYTEVFKYLSMCYVLAPEHHANDVDDFYTPTWATSLPKVSFYLAVNEKGQVERMGDDNTVTMVDADPLFTIDNVPVQRNWRTNILGGTGSGGKDDNTSIFEPHRVVMYVDISPNYDGEHNTVDNGANWGTWEEQEDGSWKKTWEKKGDSDWKQTEPTE